MGKMKSTLLIIAFAFLIAVVHMAPLDNVDVHAGHEHGDHKEHDFKCVGKAHDDDDHDDDVHGENSHEDEHDHKGHGHEGHDDYCEGKDDEHCHGHKHDEKHEDDDHEDEDHEDEDN